MIQHYFTSLQWYRSGLGAWLLITGCFAVASADEIVFGTAASVKAAVDTVVSQMPEKDVREQVRIMSGGSGVLAKQMETGAPIDLLIFADPEWVDKLVAEKLIPEKMQRRYLTNTLVLVVPGKKQTDIANMEMLSRLKQVALGNPATVPAGKYAMQALEKYGYTERGRPFGLVYGKDVLHALRYAELGEVDAAFVYRTDACASRNVRIAFEVPQDAYDPAIYVLAVSEHGTKKNEVKLLVAWLLSWKAKEIFRSFGFGICE